MKLTVDLLGDFISTLTLGGDVLSFSDDGEITNIKVDQTFHIRDRMVIQIDGTDYIVSSVVHNSDIFLEGVIPDPVLFSVSPPFYFHGTPMAVNTQVIGRKLDVDKLPMIYLYEIIKEVDKPIRSAIARESELRLFFLDNANFEEWNTDDHYSKRLLGINSLADEFISKIRDEGKFYTDDTDFSRINHTRFGSYKDQKGYEANIFDQNLTGHELSFRLKMRKCCC